MDGGLDLAIREQLGFEVERKIQEVILDKYHGELPVGCGDRRNGRLPVEVYDLRSYHESSGTDSVHDQRLSCVSRILVAVENLNKSMGKREIDSLVCSGLGTGVGGVSVGKCARQMRAAYQTVKTPARISSFRGIHEFHKTLHEL